MRLSEDELQELRRMALEGDRDAANKLFAEVRSFIRSRTPPHWAENDRSEVAQEATARLFENLPAVLDKSLLAFLARVARCRTIDEWRRVCRRKEVSLDAPGNDGQRLIDAMADTGLPSPSRNARAREEAQEERVFREVLSEECADLRVKNPSWGIAVEMFLREESIEAIARELDRSPEATRKLVSRAMKELRSRLRRRFPAADI